MPVGPKSTGRSSFGGTPATLAAAGVGALLIDAMVTATEFPGAMASAWLMTGALGLLLPQPAPPTTATPPNPHIATNANARAKRSMKSPVSLLPQKFWKRTHLAPR